MVAAQATDVLATWFSAAEQDASDAGDAELAEGATSRQLDEADPRLRERRFALDEAHALAQRSRTRATACTAPQMPHQPQTLMAAIKCNGAL